MIQVKNYQLLKVTGNKNFKRICNEIKKIIAESSKGRFDEISDRLKSIFSVPAVKCNFFVYMTIHMTLATMEYLLKRDCLHIK